VSDPGATTAATYRAQVGSQVLDLPLVELAPDLTIALLITVDHGISVLARAGAELAALLEPERVDAVATAATMGLPVAIEVARALGLDDYIVLHKTPKTHLRDALVEDVRSITTGPLQQLRLDRARLEHVAGRRVAFVDDVVSTGSSAVAALRLLRRAGAEVVGVGALVTETRAWRDALGADERLVRALGAIPVFRPGPGGSLDADWDG